MEVTNLLNIHTRAELCQWYWEVHPQKRIGHPGQVHGVPPDVVMKLTGHADYKSMKPYIDITEDAKKDAIKLMEAAFRKK